MEITKMTDKEADAANAADLEKVIKSGKEVRQRVLRFLENNSSWKIKDIVKKFNLTHDVIRDLGGDMVVAGFYSDESYRTLCFELHMTYSELKDL